MTQSSITQEIVGEAEAASLLIKGYDPDFRPAGLPPPDWFLIAMNGADYYREQAQDRPLAGPLFSEWFEAYNQDGGLTVATGLSLEAFQQAIEVKARENLGSGGGDGYAYAFWALPDGRVVLGGFDNEGGDLAYYDGLELAQSLGECGESMFQAHFDAPALIHVPAAVDPEEEDDEEEVDEEDEAMATIVHLIVSRPPR